MFYLTQFMKDTVYYISHLDTYVVAEIENDTLSLHAVFGNAKLDDVIASYGRGLKNVVLYFTPEDPEGYDVTVMDHEDTTFFTKGEAFEGMGDYKFRFQAISHA